MSIHDAEAGCFFLFIFQNVLCTKCNCALENDRSYSKRSVITNESKTKASRSNRNMAHRIPNTKHHSTFHYDTLERKGARKRDGKNCTG